MRRAVGRRAGRRGPLGYALLMVIMVLALIALGLGTVMYIVETNLTETRRIVGETRCFYGLDSVSRIASAAAQAVLAQEPPCPVFPPDALQACQAATVAKAVNAVCEVGQCSSTAPRLPQAITPQGVTLTMFQVTMRDPGLSSPPNGPFRGVQVNEETMSLYFEARDNGTGRTCRVRDSFTTGSVSPFQFMVYGAGDARWYAREPRLSPEPIYASGDFCLSGTASADLTLKLASAGRQLKAASSGQGSGFPCGTPPGGVGTVLIGGAAFTGTTNDQDSFAQAPKLRLPVEAIPDMQGENDLADEDGDVLSVRWLLDPVISADNQAVRTLRTADVADLRIIDGVWYLKRSGYAWPGFAIYSDHPSGTPGALPKTPEEAALVPSSPNSNVGMGQIKARLESYGLRSSTHPWPPRRFSWYETNMFGGKMFDGRPREQFAAACDPDADLTYPQNCRHNRGIISYGSLARLSNGDYVPGGYFGTDKDGRVCPAGDGERDFQPFRTFPFEADRATVPEEDRGCDVHSTRPSGLADPRFSTQPATALLEATRGGFRDYNAAKGASSSFVERQAKVRPINFNVRELRDALRDFRVSELGHYFSSREFNGVVYITQTWKDSLKGVTSTGATFEETLPPEPLRKPTPPLTSGSIDHTIAAHLAPAPFPKDFLGPGPAQPDDYFPESDPPATEFYLPRNLCGVGFFAGQDVTVHRTEYAAALLLDPMADPPAGLDLAPGYLIPPCMGAAGTLGRQAGGLAGNEGVRPNAVRVYHGSDLRAFQIGGGGPTPTITRSGLSIATNLPLYVLGDWNMEGPNEYGNFPRSMLAGDTITVLSREWDDRDVPWHVDFDDSSFTPRTPTPHQVRVVDGGAVLNEIGVGLMVRAGFMTGRTRSERGGAVHNQDAESAIRTLERFPASSPLALRGAIFIGFTSVFRDDFQAVDANFPVASTNFRYDSSLSNPSLQPAGTPRFLMGISGKWKDTR
jgi:hypothetical protein